MISTSTFEIFQTRNSSIHHLDPRVKLISTLLLVLSNVLLPDGSWFLFAVTLAILLCLNIISRINLGFIFKRSLIAIPFALVAFTVIFTLPGDTLTELHLFGWNLVITTQGLIRFLSILVRAWLSVLATILLTATTSFPDLAHGLRHLRVPLILIAILSFMYRYLFVLSSEAQRLMQARAARSASLPDTRKPSISWNAKIAGNMVGQLFLRSYERSDRVYDAMQARGFQGDFLTYNPHQMKPRDWGALIFFVLLLSSLHLYSGFV